MKLEDIRKLCDKATSGPWLADPVNDRVWVEKGFEDQNVICDVHGMGVGHCDLRFVAASRTLIPKLLAVAEAAKAYCDWESVYCPACGDSSDSDGLPCYCADKIDASIRFYNSIAALEADE